MLNLFENVSLRRKRLISLFFLSAIEENHITTPPACPPARDPSLNVSIASDQAFVVISYGARARDNISALIELRTAQKSGHNVYIIVNDQNRISRRLNTRTVPLERAP